MWDRFLNKQPIKQTAGNTLVEVFVALVIVGLAIAGAYATANRSIALTQAAQERAEATKIAEGKIETIKALALSEGDATYFDDSRAFCITEGASGFEREDFNPSFILLSLNDVTELSADDSLEQAYPTACVFNDRYYTHVEYNTTQSRFKVNVRWERFGGSSVEQTEIIYGVYQ